MLEDLLLEVAYGAGRMFINPLFYWSFILVIITGITRIRRERFMFGTKIDDVFSEWRRTWWVSLIFGIMLSLIMVGAGIVFTSSMILLISTVTILLSIHFRFTWLSPVYTIGLSFLLLLVLPVLLRQQSFVSSSVIDLVNYDGLAIVLGLLLFAEAVLLFAVDKKDIFGELKKSKRGIWTGAYHIKKMAVIPFFVPVPDGWLHPFFDFWPYLPVGQTNGESTFGLVLLPLLIGFHFRISGFGSQQAKKWLGKRILLLSAVVLFAGVGSLYIGWLSVAAIIIGFVGWEFIHYRLRAKDQQRAPYFSQTDSGLRILTVIPGTVADKWGILPGEVVTKANGKKVTSEISFYQALQTSGSFVKLSILDEAGEVRFVQGALYEGGHHELGLVFVGKAFREDKTS